MPKPPKVGDRARIEANFTDEDLAVIRELEARTPLGEPWRRLSEHAPVATFGFHPKALASLERLGRELTELAAKPQRRWAVTGPIGVVAGLLRLAIAFGPCSLQAQTNEPGPRRVTVLAGVGNAMGWLGNLVTVP